jgi:GTP-binding protein HflX
MAIPKLRCVILQVVNPHLTHEDPELVTKNLTELKLLVETVGAEVVETTTQHRVKPHPATFVGGGKVDWLMQVVKEQAIDVVILNQVAKSSQIFRLEQILWEVNTKIQVWDRVDLILNIFDLHANTKQAKLQIELARIEHLGPRIYGLGGTVLSKQGGGIGGKGQGETNIELEKRKMKRQKQLIRKELDLLNQGTLARIKERIDRGSKTVALVGYTSAGKTTLFNTLTGKDRETDQSLFTTLDSVTGRVKLVDYTKNILVSDTIGFIDDLPPNLIQAFRSTLQESLEANIILHVLDASDPFLESKFAVVENILQDLGVEQIPILVFNKVDLIDSAKQEQIRLRFADRFVIFISAATAQNIDTLKSALENQLYQPPTA